MRLHEVTLAEQIRSLPELRPLEVLDLTSRDISLFVCALGFEPRGLVIPEMLASKLKVRRALVCEYSTNRDDNAVNRPSLIRHLHAISSDVQSIDCDSEDFTQLLRANIEAQIASTQRDGRPVVCFDVSAAANRLLFTCIKVFLEYDIELKILYSEANSYSPSREAYEENRVRWEADEGFDLERGVSDVRVSNEYAGYHVDQLPDCVIVFPSFNRVRAQAVISAVDPSLLGIGTDNVIWLLGVPHLQNDHWRLSAMRAVNKLVDGNVQYEVSTFNYKATLERLEGIYLERVAKVKFTMAPMGSKLQALGASLFCYLHPDVRVIFATPKEYNATQYSTGCKAAWLCDFGSTSTLRAILDKVGSIELAS
jgi:hypothetical protein